MEKEERQSHHEDCVYPECSLDNSGYKCDWRMWRGHKFIKFIVILLVLIFVFSLGYGMGKVKGFIKYGGFYGSYADDYGFTGPRGMMMYTDAARYGMMSGDYGAMRQMMGGWRYGDDKKTNRTFGTIEKIEGNKITISDNSGKEKTIISASDTVIISGNEEISLSSLEVGENISVFGILNKDGQFEAKIIRVSSL